MATEAHYVLMQYVFELGYRRYEWKCDSLNQASIRAARRLGFTYEGTFRQAMVYKHRSRDTAWFAIIDQDWPAIPQAIIRPFAEEKLVDFSHQDHAVYKTVLCRDPGTLLAPRKARGASKYSRASTDQP
ncbi:MAG TPA: GNAT family N-acetyltransferase [Enteractinococcus helveticum]|uniref:GNAT family N-acetyltransferase n=1 Tax=Enteractinococcus helveticum TaxID=1837282 RepID=A0A921FLN5_9MICC|nr:GNAT family protein [Enteractinococcus helveticum]HJF14343.1 GNAT family N-acetyltransferase [Enteractinococcus helveticum]